MSLAAAVFSFHCSVSCSGGSCWQIYVFDGNKGLSSSSLGFRLETLIFPLPSGTDWGHDTTVMQTVRNGEKLHQQRRIGLISPITQSLLTVVPVNNRKTTKNVALIEKPDRH